MAIRLSLRQRAQLLWWETRPLSNLFILPFALGAAFLAARGAPTGPQLLWVALAFVSARTVGLMADRIIDRSLDALNPGARQRPLALGAVAVQEAALVGIVAAALLLFAAAQLNRLCLLLAPLALALLLLYPYTKRFTWLAHWVEGLAQSAGAVGAWIAITGRFELATWLWGLGVLLWGSSNDLIYSAPDAEFDRRQGLYSIPGRFGVAATLRLAALGHALSFLPWALVGWLWGLGPLYWVGLALATLLLVAEHRLVSPRDLSRVHFAFVNLNVLMALVVLAGLLGGLYVS